MNDLDLVVERVDVRGGSSVSWRKRDGSNNAERVTVPAAGRGGDGATSFVARVVARDVRWVPGGNRGSRTLWWLRLRG